jgi:hypothetical protein
MRTMDHKNYLYVPFVRLHPPSLTLHVESTNIKPSTRLMFVIASICVIFCIAGSGCGLLLVEGCTCDGDWMCMLDVNMLSAHLLLLFVQAQMKLNAIPIVCCGSPSCMSATGNISRS